MERGSLLNFLKTDQRKTLKFDDLCYIAFQVASGMEHLEKLNFIHRDLAARNVLLGKNNVAKICDFGLARIIQDEEYCARQGGKFPVKWTAPEAIMEGRFSTKSDVWSYGIFLMELFTYGETPYKGMLSRVVVELVLCGHRMSKPTDHLLPDDIYDVMLACWHERPDKRPTFEDLTNFFEKMDVSFSAETEKSEKRVVIKHNQPRSYEDYKVRYV